MSLIALLPDLLGCSDADLPRQEATRQSLMNILEKHGISATRELVVALHAKFLRPNSGPDTDNLIARLVDFWNAEEQRLGCAIDLRVIAGAAKNSSSRQSSFIRQVEKARQKSQEILVYPIVRSVNDVKSHKDMVMMYFLGKYIKSLSKRKINDSRENSKF